MDNNTVYEWILSTFAVSERPTRTGDMTGTPISCIAALLLLSCILICSDIAM